MTQQTTTPQTSARAIRAAERRRQARAREAERAARLLAEARDPQTAGPRLAAIVAETRVSPANARLVLEAVCANPNAPAEVVGELLPTFPDAFCRNPAAPLLALEAPDLLDTARRHAALPSLLRRAALPAPVVSLALAAVSASDHALAEAARQHVASAGEVAPGAVEDEVRAALRRMLTGGSHAHRCRVFEAVEAGLFPAWVAAGMTDPLEGVAPLPPSVRPGDRALAAERAAVEFPGALGEAVEAVVSGTALAGGGDSRAVALARLWDRDTPADELERIAAGNNGECRVVFARTLARHPHASRALLLSLVRVSDAVVRRLILRRPDVQDAVAAACRDAARPAAGTFGLLRSVHRCFGLADDPDLPPDALRAAAESDDWLERLGAARNSGLSRLSRLRQRALRHDGNRLVRAAARETLKGARGTTGAMDPRP